MEVVATYGLILLSIVMFGGSFALKNVYRAKIGSSFKKSLQFSLVSGIPGLIALFLTNGFVFEFTWFTFVMALIKATSGICLAFCGFRALGMINLSLYSLFMMLGGMVLPYLQGIVFYGEPMTFAKGICFALICVSLLLTIDKKRGKTTKGGGVYYAVIFILNGMSGVLSKYFTEAKFEKTSPAGFSIMTAITTISLSAFLLLFFIGKGDKMRQTPLTLTIAASNGILNKLANYIQVLTLANGVQASVQYSMVTGGVIMMSTLISCFGKKKPTVKVLISAAIAFIAIFALLIPF